MSAGSWRALALAASCLTAGCGIERTIAVESLDAGAAGPDDFDAATCSPPMYVLADATAQQAVGPYFLRNNEWNTAAGPGPQTLYACSFSDWYVVSQQTDDGGAVESYPNVQMDFGDDSASVAGEPDVTSFQAITSSFAVRGPGVGSYEFAYDVWLNGIGKASSNQVLVWVDSFDRAPSGDHLGPKTVDGRVYDVWAAPDGSSVILQATTSFSSGTVNLLAIVAWAIEQNLVPPTSTLGQIGFGVEIVSTGGKPATFFVDDFEMDAH